MSTKIKNTKNENLQLPKDKKKKKILMSRGNFYDEEKKFQTLPNIQMVGMDIQDVISEIIIDNNIDLFEGWNVNIEFHNNHNSFRTLVEKNYFSNSGMGREFFENKDNYIVIDFAWLQMKTLNELKEDSGNESVQIESVHNAFVQNLFKHIWLLVASMNVAKHKKMILDNGKFGKTFQSFYIDDKSEFGNIFEELKEDEKWIAKSYPTLNFSSNSFDIVNKYFTTERIERIINLMVNSDNLKTRNNKTSKKLRHRIDVVSNNGNKMVSDLQTSKKDNEVLQPYGMVENDAIDRLLNNKCEHCDNHLTEKEVKRIVTKKS